MKQIASRKKKKTFRTRRDFRNNVVELYHFTGEEKEAQKREAEEVVSFKAWN